MKNYLFILLVGLSSSVFAQKLSKEQLIDKLSGKTCECVSKQELTKDNYELTFGLCILENLSEFEKDVEKHYGKNAIQDEEKKEEIGRDIGKRMASICPQVFKVLIDEMSKEEAEVEEAELKISGKISEIKSEQFIVFSVKEDTGKINSFILLNNFENAYLLTDKVLKVNDAVEIIYYELELYDAKISKFITYKIVSDIIKK